MMPSHVVKHPWLSCLHTQPQNSVGGRGDLCLTNCLMTWVKEVSGHRDLIKSGPGNRRHQPAVALRGLLLSDVCGPQQLCSQRVVLGQQPHSTWDFISKAEPQTYWTC